MAAEAVVHFALDRCNQENLVEQLKNGVRALRVPAHDLASNWAYIVIGSLAWNLKAWFGLLQPRRAHQALVLTMEFKKFLRAFVLIPCQLVRGGRRLVYRLVSWNPCVPILLRSVEALRRLRLT